MVGSCKHGNESVGFTQWGELLGHLWNY